MKFDRPRIGKEIRTITLLAGSTYLILQAFTNADLIKLYRNDIIHGETTIAAPVAHRTPQTTSISPLISESDIDKLTLDQYNTPHISTDMNDELEARHDAYTITFNTLPPVNQISIDSINVNAPIISNFIKPKEDVLAGDFNNELMEGVALYPGTAAPGTPGHGLIFGHSSQERWIKNEYSTIFAKLYELEVGDTFSITRKGSLYRYRMVEQVVVQPENVIDIYNKRNKDRHHISLISCWPLGTRRRRMVVTAELIDTPTTTTLLSYNQ